MGHSGRNGAIGEYADYNRIVNELLRTSNHPVPEAAAASASVPVPAVVSSELESKPTPQIEKESSSVLAPKPMSLVAIPAIRPPPAVSPVADDKFKVSEQFPFSNPFCIIAER